MLDLGVYLHFPWCRKRCPYCDFAVEVGEVPHEPYLDAILRELDARAPAFGGELVSIKTGKDFSAEIGQPISATVPARACHFFDQKTGRRAGGMAA